MISIWLQFNCHIADRKCHLHVDIVYSILKTLKISYRKNSADILPRAESSRISDTMIHCFTFYTHFSYESNLGKGLHLWYTDSACFIL